VAGVTEIEVRTAGVTVRVDEFPIVPEVAVIVAVPVTIAVATPEWIFTVAIEVFDEVQVAVAVRFCAVPLL